MDENCARPLSFLRVGVAKAFGRRASSVGHRVPRLSNLDLRDRDMSNLDLKDNNVAPMASEDEDKTSKASSEATAPQASPKKGPGGPGEFHHHVVPTEHCGALNVYVQVSYLILLSKWKKLSLITLLALVHLLLYFGYLIYLSY